RTRGIITTIVGQAIAQEIIHDVIHVQIRLSPGPIARQVATPDTRKVMKNDVPKDRAKRMQTGGNFFTAAGTIWYGLPRRPSPELIQPMPTTLPFRTAKQLASAVRKRKIGCLELLDLYLKRVEAHNPKLNAIIATDIPGARKHAKAADKALKAGK